MKKEEMYDGFYAVITNLEGDVSEIIRINKQRWEIRKETRRYLYSQSDTWNITFYANNY